MSRSADFFTTGVTAPARLSRRGLLGALARGASWPLGVAGLGSLGGCGGLGSRLGQWAGGSGSAGGAAAAEAPLTAPAGLWVLGAEGVLWRIEPDAPGRVRGRSALMGLASGERWLGLCGRPSAKAWLWGLSSRGHLYTVAPANGQAQRLGPVVPAVLQGQRFGMAYSPPVGRIRVVSDRGENLRLHPDTGLLVAMDQPLHYGAGDPRQGQTPRLAALACAHPPGKPAASTHYAIDLAAGSLVWQGSPAGVVPAQSPSSGVLRTVGALGTGALEDAALDIRAADGSAWAALRHGGDTGLYRVDLASGKAQLLGRLADGGPVRGMAWWPG